MRVISQDGTLDLPYEGISLKRDKNVIRAGYSSVLQRGVVGAVLAEYATEEKALKAMEQLRDAYTNHEYYLRVISGAINIDMIPKEAKKDYRKLLETARKNCVFRFPADEDPEA